MGYRSEIIAGVPAKDKKKALEIMNDWDEYALEDDMFYMRAESWKWYDSYDEVSKFSKFILENEKDRFLMAVGEDGMLVEELGDPWEHGVEYIAHIDHGIFFEDEEVLTELKGIKIRETINE